MVGETSGRDGFEFEGVMVRQPSKPYESRNNYHSPCLLKYKRFLDDEWDVCGAEPCVGGTQDGAIKWLCSKTVDGKVLKVTAKQMGDCKTTKKMYSDYKKNSNKFIEKKINIRYNETSKDGVPRFPRATAFREDID